MTVRDDLVRAAVHRAFDLKGKPGFREACERVVHLHAIAPLIELRDEIREAEQRLEARKQQRADLIALLRDTDPAKSRAAPEERRAA
jgi:hypothetical protein